MSIFRIILVIFVVVVLFGLAQVLLRNKKDMSKKEAFWVGAFGGLGCILPLLFHMFMFFVFIFVLFMLYSWIFG